MLISMTGFGRAVQETPFGQLTVEIQSVNRKYLEVFVSLPKELSRYEMDLRRQVSEKISRGQVSLKVFISSNKRAVEEFLPDLDVLKEVYSGWKRISENLGLDPKAITLPFLIQTIPQEQKNELVKEEDVPILKQAVDEALKELVKMKLKEGQALNIDLSNRLKELEKFINQIEKTSPDATEKLKQKLTEKLKEAFEMGPELEDRVLKEIAFFAEKVDISEEITRFRSHVLQFQDLLKKGGVGRKMDFLIQEMGREINTIGSKASDFKIAHIVVEMKSELEKMREQGQNIE